MITMNRYSRRYLIRACGLRACQGYLGCQSLRRPVYPRTPRGRPGHGPAMFTPLNAQVFSGRSNGAQWGNILVSTNVRVDTKIGIPYGNITYNTCECNSTGGWAEFGRYGEIKILFKGCTAVFYTAGIVLGPPDVALDSNNYIYYTAGNYTGGAIIWRYAASSPVNMVINDFSTGRGDYVNIRGDMQSAGVTTSYPSWGTQIVVYGTGGSISIFGVRYDPKTISWA